jgi:arylsulfatase A-like enzyme
MGRDGTLRDTIVVVTADHGESLGEHGLMGHHVLLHEEVLRVPLVVRAPGLPGPRVVTEPASLVDVAPTILSLAGLAGATPRTVQGRDLLAPRAEPRGVFAEWWGLLPGRPRGRLERGLFGDDLTARQVFAFIEHAADKDSAKAIVQGRWKLLWTSNGSVALYDLAADPGETRDLAAARPEVCRELGAALLTGLPPAEEGDPEGDHGVREFRHALRTLGYVR